MERWEVAEAIEAARSLALAELTRLRMVKSIPVAAPGAGQEWIQAVPPNSVWELLNARTQFATSAVVANRNTQLAIRDPDGVELARYVDGTSLAANTTTVVSYVAGLGFSNVTSGHTLGLASPPQLLLAGWTVRSLTVNMDVGDTHTAVALLVREWSPRAILMQTGWLRYHLR